jgi:hypothetical protein
VLQKRRDLLTLKKNQEITRNKFNTSAKLEGWRTLYNIVKLPDGSLRPPDKTFNIRAYSNMDRDMWDGGERGETLRGWFQKNAEVRDRVIHDNEKTGYLVPSMNRSQSCSDVMQVRHYESRILNRSPYTIPAEPAGQYFSLPSYRSDA